MATWSEVEGTLSRGGVTRARELGPSCRRGGLMEEETLQRPRAPHRRRPSSVHALGVGCWAGILGGGEARCDGALERSWKDPQY